MNSLKLAARAAALFAALKLASVTEYAGASESESKRERVQRVAAQGRR